MFSLFLPANTTFLALLSVPIELLLLAVNFKLQTRLKCFVKELMPGNFVENVFLGATWWECVIFIETTNKILC